MYRLIKFRNVNLNNLPGVSFYNNSNNTKINVSNKTCLLCQELNSLSNFSQRFVRNQSTNTSPNVATKKTRRKPRLKGIKKYAELLVVTDKSTTEHKAKIQHLRPNDLKMLALTNFNLNELYKLKDFIKNNNNTNIMNEHTYNNLTDTNNISDSMMISVPNLDKKFSEENVLPVINDRLNKVHENLEHLSMQKEAQNDPTDVFIKIKQNAAFQPEVFEEMIEPEETIEIDESLESKEEIIPKRIRLYDKKAREEMISLTLAAYFEVCCNIKSPQRALNALHFHRYRVSKGPRDKFPPMTDIKVYNAILKGFAAKGDYPKLKEVLKYIHEENVLLNAQSYSAIFECLARVNYSDSHLKDVRVFTKHAQKDGFTFDRILNEATFLYDQRIKVLEVMHMYDHHYVHKYLEPSVQFKNVLVDHLNDPKQLDGFPEESKEVGGIFTEAKLAECIKKQIDIEKNVFVVVKSIEAKPEVTEEIKNFRESWSEHIKMWEEAALEAFNRDLAALTAQRSALNFEPYMRSIPTKDFIAIIVDEAQKLAQGSETYSPTVNQLYRELGAKVYSRYKVLKKQKTGVLDKMTQIHSKYCKNYAQSHSDLGETPTIIDHLNPRQKWQWAEHSFKPEGATILMDHQEWVSTSLVHIGKFLYHIVMHDMKIDVNVLRNNKQNKNYLPAFYTIFRNQGRIVKEEVKPHPILSKLYRASVPETLSFPAYEVPMKCPPVPWVSVQTGGYLICPCEVVRLPSQATMQRQRLAEADPNTLYPSLDALNQLASVPWMVNKGVLDVIIQVFRNGGSSKLDVPEPPSSLTPIPPVNSDMDKSQKFQNFRNKLQQRRKKAEMYSMWCDCLYRLSLANHYRDDVFWLPHNMDFRGRVYPVPPHLNHLGSDLSRCMLVFAEARPLGKHGLDWLKLHLINLTGLKKRERIQDRLVYANEIMEDILDSADNPLNGKQWWVNADEPWQALSCCMEIAAAHRSADPEKHLSHFPVHQDGSCNGLQHYAALGRDSAGAFSVNLCPSEVPQDVYSAVATLVEEKRANDSENGSEIAKTLDGFVKRKVIKQTVMTTVYGVTRFGARLQIARQLKDIDNFPKDSVWAGSAYLTGRTFESLRSMFTSTREIQDWFTDCARLISSVCGQNVEWITPMGLPIVQPYFRYKQINPSGVYETFHMDKYEKPNVMKQKNAFPPNFIHSLDSSHMMLTSLHCERAGITFVSVHDCYWTHPSTVHIMNKICREQFVALHSEPILEDLSVFMTNKYSYNEDEITDDGSVTDLTKRKLNRMLRKLPKTGNFNIKEVLDSVYFFS